MKSLTLKRNASVELLRLFGILMILGYHNIQVDLVIEGTYHFSIDRVLQRLRSDVLHDHGVLSVSENILSPTDTKNYSKDYSSDTFTFCRLFLSVRLDH